MTSEMVSGAKGYTVVTKKSLFETKATIFLRQILKNCKLGRLSVKTKMGIGERNEGNAENKGGNARNGMIMRVQGISVGMRNNVRESGW